MPAKHERFPGSVGKPDKRLAIIRRTDDSSAVGTELSVLKT
jgi:hypothetical protein